MTTAADSNEIRIIRRYDAPVARVWDAWTDPAQVAQWWGPRGFTITTHDKDLRVGGSWVYTMHGPDGKDWPNFTRYHVVEPHARLVYDHGASSEDAAPLFRMSVTFRALGEGTELDLRMTLATPEAARETRTFIKAAGGNATWDRLAEFLERQRSSSEIFVINRAFDAPTETVFDMFTVPRHLAAWLPPAGFTMTWRHADVRAGGEAAFTMTNGDVAMHGRHHYLLVQRPDRLQYTQVFTDEHGRTARHPGSPTWPEATLVTVTFTAETAATTRVTVRFEVSGAVTDEELATFVAERAGMTRGWNGSFDVLETMLADHATAAAAPV